MFSLPRTATAPFCPSEVQGSIHIDAGAPFAARLKRFVGPGLLVAIGYMDPGNWATDIEAGAHFGYALLWVVAVSSIAAMFLQLLTARLGLVTGQDLAQLSYQRYGPVGRAVQKCRSSPATWPRCWAAHWRSTCCWACRWCDPAHRA